MKIIASVPNGDAIQCLLDDLREPTQAPRIAPAASGPPWEEDFEPHQGADLRSPHPSMSLTSG
jgi:hypothetical protein